ncbi:hypothetical protein ATE92_0083 [Ulvibacter sp. MAR_2010_11]|nr:hypothetical protein ATE92_0083 [Ulvibacter sp. MAR_2010_11]
MNKENVLLIIWIIFGFVFITAIDSLLYLFTHLIYFVESELRLSYSFLQYSIPSITFIAYISTTFLILKRIKAKSDSEGIYLRNFPKKTFIILALIAIFLNPITNKLSGLYAEHNAYIQSGSSSEFISFYGWMHFGIGFSRWVVLIVLVFVYMNKIKDDRLKN